MGHVHRKFIQLFGSSLPKPGNRIKVITVSASHGLCATVVLFWRLLENIERGGRVTGKSPGDRCHASPHAARRPNYSSPSSLPCSPLTLAIWPGRVSTPSPKISLTLTAPLGTNLACPGPAGTASLCCSSSCPYSILGGVRRAGKSRDWRTLGPRQYHNSHAHPHTFKIHSRCTHRHTGKVFVLLQSIVLFRGPGPDNYCLNRTKLVFMRPV